MTLDAHQHFWRFDPVRDAWITPDMAVIRRDFLPADLAPTLVEAGIQGCVAVQADQSDAETAFLLDLAEQNAFIEGVAGWVDVRAQNLPERLEALKKHKKLKGFRHILQGERPEFMLQPDFIAGLRRLGEANFTYDILVFPRHLEAVHALLKRLDAQPLIIDHMSKPYIRRGLLKQWAKDMRRLARHEHLYVKVSGLVTEADWAGWKPADLSPYLDVVLEAFGPKRLVYGSDWPVCLTAASYQAQLNVVKNYIARLSADEQAAIMGGNGRRFYKIGG